MELSNIIKGKKLLFYFIIIHHILIQIWILMIILSRLSEFRYPLEAFLIFYITGIILAFVSLFLPAIFENKLEDNEVGVIIASGLIALASSAVPIFATCMC